MINFIYPLIIGIVLILIGGAWLFKRYSIDDSVHVETPTIVIGLGLLFIIISILMVLPKWESVEQKELTTIQSFLELENDLTEDEYTLSSETKDIGKHFIADTANLQITILIIDGEIIGSRITEYK